MMLMSQKRVTSISTKYRYLCGCSWVRSFLCSLKRRTWWTCGGRCCSLPVLLTQTLVAPPSHALLPAAPSFVTALLASALCS